MERESFENDEVASLLNEAFVCIKVDREERPDIDAVYMEAARMMSDGGGWPLTIITTPDGKPFFAATYIPRTGRLGMAGMLELLPRISDLWRTRREQLDDAAARVADALSRDTGRTEARALGEDTLAEAYRELRAAFDPEHGGFGAAPKFPAPHQLLFLLRYWKRTGEPAALDMVERTLSAMRMGGIYDQVGHGFHRYSTDAEWLLPHFEKMLYDQALHVMALAEASLAARDRARHRVAGTGDAVGRAGPASGDETYEGTGRGIIEYVLRDMTDPGGGFYSAEDADSEGAEGKFYTWTLTELRDVLGRSDANLVARVFGVSEEGNVRDEATGRRTGSNVLHLTEELPELAASLGIEEASVAGRIESAVSRLFEVRSRRVRPRLDDKVLTDWNGLMISALARAAQAWEEPEYAEAARRCADFILETMRDANGRLLHRYRDGEAAIAAGADDYAFLSMGLFDLYEATHEPRYLRDSARLTEEMLTLFWDTEGGGFYLTPSDGERLIARPRQVYDGATPSSNSVALLNLLRLGAALARPELEERADRLLRALSGAVGAYPSAYTMFLTGLDYAVGPSAEVVVAGDPVSDDTLALLSALRTSFLPNKVVLLKPDGDDRLGEVAPWVGHHEKVGGRAAAYVCRRHACGLPMTDTETLRRELGGT
jgi:uncharacterized protein YyaL (SSP411 family)